MKVSTVSNLEYLNWLKNFACNSVPESDERFAGIDIVYRSARLAKPSENFILKVLRNSKWDDSREYRLSMDRGENPYGQSIDDPKHIDFEIRQRMRIVISTHIEAMFNELRDMVLAEIETETTGIRKE